MENNKYTFKLPKNSQIIASAYSNATIDEVYLYMNKDSEAGIELINLLEKETTVNTNDAIIYSIETPSTGGWIHIGIVDNEILIGQCIRVFAY